MIFMKMVNSYSRDLTIMEFHTIAQRYSILLQNRMVAANIKKIDVIHPTALKIFS